MPNRRPHRGSRRHFDDTSRSVQIEIAPVGDNKQAFRQPGSNFIEVTSPFHPEFVKRIKKIPWQERYWDKERKVWGISVKYQPILIQIIGQIWQGKAQITFKEGERHTNVILKQQRALVDNALTGFREDNMDTLRLWIR